MAVSTNLRNLDVIVLAGGLGTRLQSVLPPGIPKALAPVDGQPFLLFLLRLLYRRGLRNIVLALGFGSAHIASLLSKQAWPGDLDLRMEVESEPLGTGGAIRNALPLTGSDPVLVLNGDTVADVDYAGLIEFHRSRAAKMTLALTSVADASRYGAVEHDATGRVTSFQEKHQAGSRPGEINAGVYAFSRAVVSAFPNTTPLSLERDILPVYCSRGLYAFAGCTRFLDIGTPESLAESGRFFRQLGELGS